MQVEQVSITDVRESVINPRDHNERNLSAIRASLETHGQVLPLLVRRETSEVIGGNGRLRVMREMGWDTVSVIYADDLSNADAIALGIALNKTSDLAGWDIPALGDILNDLDIAGMDVAAATGFAPGDIEAMIGTDSTGFTIDPEPPADQDDIPEGSDARGCRPIAVTPDMRITIDEAVHHLRTREEAPEITEGRCIELICGEWFSGR